MPSTGSLEIKPPTPLRITLRAHPFPRILLLRRSLFPRPPEGCTSFYLVFRGARVGSNLAQLTSQLSLGPSGGLIDLYLICTQS